MIKVITYLSLIGEINLKRYLAPITLFTLASLPSLFFFFSFFGGLGSSLHSTRDYHSTLAALTPIIIFSENFEIFTHKLFFLKHLFFGVKQGDYGIFRNIPFVEMKIN
jgi:hypothetical protein